jgi:hypothetical protein
LYNLSDLNELASKSLLNKSNDILKINPIASEGFNKKI